LAWEGIVSTAPDRLKHQRELFALLWPVVIPAIIAAAGLWIQYTTAERAAQREYVQIALGILRDAPPGATKEGQDLRTWAIDVVDQFAPVKLSEGARDELLRNKLGLDQLAFGRAALGSGCEDTYLITGNATEFDLCNQRARERGEKERQEQQQPRPNDK
jgi:hypothetical protein